MALPFTLYYSQREAVFVMNGGPLTKEFTEAEWNAYVQSQPAEYAAFYKRWAADAVSHPNVNITRRLS